MSLQPVFRQVLEHAASSPGGAAIVSGERSLSYAELARAVHRRAAVLASRLQIAAGDRVAVTAEPTVEFIETYLAIHGLGAICVPLDPRLPPDRLGRIVNRVAPEVLVSRQRLAAGGRHLALFSELAPEADEPLPDLPDLSLDQGADILLTTGTTADPKAVLLSHRAVAAAARHINRFVGTRPDDVEVLSLPLHHSFGLGRMRSVLSLGATLVLTPGFMDGARLTDALATHRATGFATVPAGVAILLSDHGSRLARFAGQLRYLELGSSPMPARQKLALLKLLPNTRICMHYGLTEASRSAFSSFHEDQDRLDSIGRPGPGVEMRIVDSSGQPAKAGATGEIEIRGEHLMTAYWRDPELTAASLRDGWFRTGDLGTADADGYYYLEGRSDDLINVGGRKVLPQEIERVLLEHPAVADCACAGIPDPQGLSGEIVCAWLVPGRGETALPAFSELAALLRRELEPYKVPRKFHWTGEIPRSPAGKILRHRLREPG